MRLTYFLTTLLLIVSTSCLTVKQTAVTKGTPPDWNTIKTFGFRNITADSVPLSMGESIYQVIEEGIRGRFANEGLTFSMTPDLLVDLRFSFSNPNFVDVNNTPALMNSQKYKVPINKKLMGFYKDGVVDLTVMTASDSTVFFASQAKGFVSPDGSEVGLVQEIKRTVPPALLKNFFDTGKPSIKKQVKMKQKEEMKELRRLQRERDKVESKAASKSVQKSLH